MSLFNISNTFFELFNYKLSYLEFFAGMFGLAGVWLSARNVIWNWPVGIINIILAGIFYYQIQLYPDMLLQIFFFVTSLVGWWRWAHPKAEEADKNKALKVSYMRWNQILFVLVAGIIGTIFMGNAATRLHEWLPQLFSLPSAYPYVDSFILVMSIITTFYVIQKKIECWIIWIVVDLTAAYIYFIKEAYFFSFEYLIFTILAAYGLLSWIKEVNSYGSANTTAGNFNS
jgi:nicotinamide mononucleotide transporter